MDKKRKSLSHRRFSESFQRSIIKELDSGGTRVVDIMRDYQVCRETVYRWRGKYSVHYKRQTRVIVEKKSEGEEKVLLKARIAELEAALGRKQMELDYKSKLMELMGDELKIDLEKKGAQLLSNDSANTKRNTPGQ